MISTVFVVQLVCATVSDSYNVYFSAVSPTRDPVLRHAPQGALPGGEKAQQRLAEAMLAPLQFALQRDLERLAVEAAGGLPASPADNDLNGDGRVDNADWNALVEMVWNSVAVHAPLANRFTLGLVPASVAYGETAHAASPGVIATRTRLLHDSDGDGIQDLVDNCLRVPNPDQSNIDGDPLGDACDNDADADGIADVADSCQMQSSPPSLDADQDGCPDIACDIPRWIPHLRMTNEGVRNALLVKAEHACSMAQGGNVLAASGSLRALTNHARAQAGQHLYGAHADFLARMAGNARQMLGAE